MYRRELNIAAALGSASNAGLRLLVRVSSKTKAKTTTKTV
jgi:hypothetical protein